MRRTHGPFHRLAWSHAFEYRPNMCGVYLSEDLTEVSDEETKETIRADSVNSTSHFY